MSKTFFSIGLVTLLIFAGVANGAQAQEDPFLVLDVVRITFDENWGQTGPKDGCITYTALVNKATGARTSRTFLEIGPKALLTVHFVATKDAKIIVCGSTAHFGVGITTP
jgi:hypothetical protein